MPRAQPPMANISMRGSVEVAAERSSEYRSPRASQIRSMTALSSASLASDLPFIIVRGETKEYGTANRIEGPFEPGELVCLVEDVVTTGGALVEAVAALREAGLLVRQAVCVVDREDGGSDALARVGVRLRALFRAEELVGVRKTAAKRHG